jgi:hypothetical protein
LSAKEREILENHLQAEIAAEIQRLMREADKQVIAINQELQARHAPVAGRSFWPQAPSVVQHGAEMLARKLRPTRCSWD